MHEYATLSKLQNLLKNVIVLDFWSNLKAILKYRADAKKGNNDKTAHLNQIGPCLMDGDSRRHLHQHRLFSRAVCCSRQSSIAEVCL